MRRLLELACGVAWILLAVRWTTFGLFAVGISLALSLAWLLWPVALVAILV